MIGKRKSQRELFDVGNVFPLNLPRSSFHAQLAAAAPRLFKDEDFSAFYSKDMGRPSVPPSLLALATILQCEAQVSDEEAINRTAYDLRWAAVLSRPAGIPLCAKSTLQLFRAHLIIHERARTIFFASIQEARRSGLLKGQALRIALDTKPINGRGAVTDTYNLLASGIRQLSTALARNAGERPDDWMHNNDLSRYTEPSIKGSAEIDWSDEQARNDLLSGIVRDAMRLLTMVSSCDTKIVEASELLRQLLLQDIETDPTLGPDATPGSNEFRYRLRRGTHPERIPSATDREMRHGRKSQSKRFVGSKASAAADTKSQIIVAVDVISANQGDATGALRLVEQSEENTGIAVDESIGDCAYGGGETRQSFVQAGRTIIAKVPKENDNGGLFPKHAFEIDLVACRVTCPAGESTSKFSTLVDGRRDFTFAKEACNSCPLKSKCTASKRGRTVTVHPQESLLRKARAYQASLEGRARLLERVVIEHRLARLGQLGIGQARYVGLAKTRFQLMMAASIANFRRTWNWEQAFLACAEGVSSSASTTEYPLSALLGLAVQFVRNRLSKITLQARMRISAFLSVPSARYSAFRLDF